MKDYLKKICNYSDKKANYPSVDLHYIDFQFPDDKKKLIIKNRELVIDAIINDKIEELEEFRKNHEKVSEVVISSKIMKINLTAKTFQSYDLLWKEVVDFLNTNTNNPKYVPTINTSLDYQLSGNFDIDRRKIITKISISSNIISHFGRVGTGNAVIYGSKFLPYLNGESLPLNLYHSDLVDDDKIIICRSNNIYQPGLLLVDNSEFGHYYFDRTPNWDAQYCWFRIL